jgi:anti-anti-sigma regulatory factor
MTASDEFDGEPRESPQRAASWSVWTGEVTWRQVAELREQLFDAMDIGAGDQGLDVRGVRVIDRTGIALLIGANHRARSLGRALVLLDSDGPVTEALRRAHAITDLDLAPTSGFPRPRSGSRDQPSST